MDKTRLHQLILKAVEGYIRSLYDLRHEVSNPPISNRESTKRPAYKLIKKLNLEIGEYKKIARILREEWQIGN